MAEVAAAGDRDEAVESDSRGAAEGDRAVDHGQQGLSWPRAPRGSTRRAEGMLGFPNRLN